jgi:hypothetical protein
VCHHGETPPQFAGSGRLDGRVQRQQIRLGGDFRDGRDHRADLFGCLAQGGDGRRCMRRLPGCVSGVLQGFNRPGCDVFARSRKLLRLVRDGCDVLARTIGRIGGQAGFGGNRARHCSCFGAARRGIAAQREDLSCGTFQIRLEHLAEVLKRETLRLFRRLAQSLDFPIMLGSPDSAEAQCLHRLGDLPDLVVAVEGGRWRSGIAIGQCEGRFDHVVEWPNEVKVKRDLSAEHDHQHDPRHRPQHHDEHADLSGRRRLDLGVALRDELHEVVDDRAMRNVGLGDLGIVSRRLGDVPLCKRRQELGFDAVPDFLGLGVGSIDQLRL